MRGTCLVLELSSSWGGTRSPFYPLDEDVFAYTNLPRGRTSLRLRAEAFCLFFPYSVAELVLH